MNKVVAIFIAFSLVMSMPIVSLAEDVETSVKVNQTNIQELVDDNQGTEDIDKKVENDDILPDTNEAGNYTEFNKAEKTGDVSERGSDEIKQENVTDVSSDTLSEQEDTANLEEEDEKLIVADDDTMIKTLCEHGYAYDTATALEEENLKELYSDIMKGREVEASTCAIEIDNLAAIEEFLKTDEDTLNAQGVSDKVIEENAKQVSDILNMSNQELKKEGGLSTTEVKILRKAEDNAKNEAIDNKEIKNEVDASGGISSSKLKYTQSKTNLSSKTKPIYKINFTYSWAKPYVIHLFTDYIAVGWGGDFNSKSESGSAKYYWWEGSNRWIGNCKKTASMGKYAIINRGFKFSIPQGKWVGKQYEKTKKGSASLIIYKNKKNRKATKVISAYCHQVIKLGSSNGISVSLSSNHLSVSLKIGTAFDKSSQQNDNVNN
ncbi:MAG: hypothetical protein LBM02_06115 [Lachnospiraceae bacterium]|nr:hypothetical protein [Lachnospiraceae bacterium]